MTVMPAQMSLAGDFGSIGQGRKFFDRQSIEFGADHDGRAIGQSLIDGRYPMSAEVGDDRVRFA
ncbi:hypothetical protein D3C78_1867890 [compost metagenome]